MTLFQHIPWKALRDNRDHIMVVTHEQNITTLRLRDLLHVAAHYTHGHTVVTYHKGNMEAKMIIQEYVSVFLGRCEGLLEALKLEDCVLINQHYCPKRQAS